MRIKEIAVKNLGPIKEFKCEPVLINCIYGPNEAGKTLMVEFIIHSLFREANYWKDFRDLSTAMGKVRVEIFQDNQSLIREFLPDFSKGRKQKIMKEGKIEKFFPISNIHRLLIVKSGDVNIDSDHPLTKESLVRLFSQSNLYTQITTKILPVIRSAQIKDGIINISKIGEGKLYYNLKEEIKSIEILIDEILSQYNPAQLKEIEKVIERLEKERELQIKAKKYKAFKLYTQIEKLKNELKDLPSLQEIDFIKEKIEEFNNLNFRLKEKEEKLNELENEAEVLEKLYEEFRLQTKARGYYAYKLSEKIKALKSELDTKYPEELLGNLEKNIEKWKEKAQEFEHKKEKAKKLEKEIAILNDLESIRDTYTQLIENPPLKKPQISVLMLSFLFILLGSLLPLLGLIWAVPGVFLGLAGILYFLFRYYKSSKDVLKSKEIETLKNRFKELTGQEFVSLSVLSFQIDALKEKKTTLENLALDRIKSECEVLYRIINDNFKILGCAVLDEYLPDRWEKLFEKFYENLSKLKQERRKKEEELKLLENILLKLDVNETEYIKEFPGIEFDKEKFEELKKSVEKLKDIKTEILKLRDEINNIKSEIDKLGKEIGTWLTEYTKIEVESENWKKAIKTLEQKINTKTEELRKLEGELDGLEVTKEDFITEDPGLVYQKGLLDKIEVKIKEMAEKKYKTEEKLQSLKAKISQITGKDITTPWPELINSLYKKREEKKNELKSSVARIVGGYLVNNIMEKEKRDIENWLEDMLNSDEIKSIIERITAKYKEFKIEGEEILISDGYTNFSLRDLSTGAKEQVLVGLRIGMIQKLFNSLSGFLIFDDAFQHVDWKKREKLVDTLVDFAEKSQWQIFYFTMDDHIKYLFEKHVKKNPDLVKIWTMDDTSQGSQIFQNKISTEKKETKISGFIFNLFPQDK